MKSIKIVHVFWQDSSVGYGWVDDEELPRPRTINTIGAVVEDTDLYIVIAASWDENPTTSAHPWGQVIAIPKTAIAHMDHVRLEA